MSMSTRLALDIFILISYILQDDISKPAVISVVRSEIVIIISCIQNNKEKLILDDSETEFS